MSAFEELAFDPASFSGRVRLFPLPNLVMFPHVVQPLHIFEQRYREMLEDALNDDKLIAMALLSPGWEAEYDGRPALAPVACLGRIAKHHRLPDGRSNILLVGLRRVRLSHELPPHRSFREAEARLVDDEYPAAGVVARPALRSRLMAAFKRKLQKSPQEHEQIDHLLGCETTLGMLTDLAAYALELDPCCKSHLLQESNVDRRAALLLDRLEALDGVVQKADLTPPFPPGFSRN